MTGVSGSSSGRPVFFWQMQTVAVSQSMESRVRHAMSLLLIPVRMRSSMTALLRIERGCCSIAVRTALTSSFVRYCMFLRLFFRAGR